MPHRDDDFSRQKTQTMHTTISNEKIVQFFEQLREENGDVKNGAFTSLDAFMRKGGGRYNGYMRYRLPENLDEMDFRGTDLKNILFEKTKSCKGTNFSGVDLSNNQLYFIDFSDAICIGTNFTGSMLRQVQFNRADLTNANFTNANLENAQFPEAELQGANFEGAKNVKEGNFRTAKNYDISNARPNSSPELERRAAGTYSKRKDQPQPIKRNESYVEEESNNDKKKKGCCIVM